MHYVIYLPTLSIDSNKEEHHFKRFVGWFSPFRLDEYGVRVGRPFSIGSTLKARMVMYFVPKFISSHFPFRKDDGTNVTFWFQLPSPRKLIFYLTMSGWLITVPEFQTIFSTNVRIWNET